MAIEYNNQNISNLPSTNEGILRKIDSKTYESIKTNLSASSPPTASNDTTEGYKAGSLWIDINANNIYKCIDPTEDEAIWQIITEPNITQLFWHRGDPESDDICIPSPATLSGDAVYETDQVRLTRNVNGLIGGLEWDFLLNLKDTFFAIFHHYAGGGTGADGFCFYFGANATPNSATNPTNLTKGIAVTIDSWNDRLRLYINGSQVTEVTGLTAFDNGTWQKWRILMRGKFIRVVNYNYGSADTNTILLSSLPDMSGTKHGVVAQTGGANNNQYTSQIGLYNSIVANDYSS